MDAPKSPIREVITLEHAEQHRLQIEAINKLTNEFSAFRAKKET